MQRIFRLLNRILVLVAVVYFGLMLWLYIAQHDMVFLPGLPTRDIERTPASLGLAFEDLVLHTPDREQLHGWYIPHPQSRHVVLFLHGNAGNISHRLDTISRLRELGVSILLFDYRGFGQSSGEVTEQGTYIDARSAWNYLHRELGYSERQIIVHGRSLGGAVAAELATRVRPAAVILESTFTSIPHIGAEVYPWLPVDWLARIRYDSLARIGHIRAPLLIMHSPQDELIPYAHGQALYEAARAPRQFVPLRADHNNGFRYTTEYVPALRKFLLQHLVAYQSEQVH